MSSIGDRESEIEDEVFDETEQCIVRPPCDSLFSEGKKMPNISSQSGQDERPPKTQFSGYDESQRTSQSDYSPQSSPSLPHASFCRHRSSLSKRGVKELKRKVSERESEIKYLKETLETTEKRLLTLLRENPYHVYITGEGNTVQIGNNNSIVEEVHNEETSDAIAGLEELIKKLTTAVEVNIRERSSTEIKLDKTEAQLIELKQSIKVFTDKIEKRNETDNDKLCDLKGMLETLISERTDQSVITDGLAKLKTLDKAALSSEEFPEDVKKLAKLMTKRFGLIKWTRFAEYLKVVPMSVTSNDLIMDCDLDEQMCVNVLVKFLQSPSNSAEKLMTVIKMYDEQKIQEKIENLQKKTFGSTRPLPAVPSTQHRQSVSGSGIAEGFTNVPNKYLQMLETIIKKADKADENDAKVIALLKENNTLLKDHKAKRNLAYKDETFV